MNGIPDSYKAFVETYPELEKAWDAVRGAEKKGPLDEKTIRLVKLGISIGAMREGAVHSALRKASAAGASREEIRQVIALAVSTIGFPSAVAVYTWAGDVPDGKST